MPTEGTDTEVGPGTPPAGTGKPIGPLRPIPGQSGTGELPASTLRDRVVLLLTNGMTVEAAESYCISQRQDLDTARRTVSEARQRITVAADYARDEQLGKAVMRLEDLYAKSIAGKDVRSAIAAQKELNRLLRLYDAPEQAPQAGGQQDDEGAANRLDLIAGYLLPLKLADARYPVEEHARVAADIIRTRGLQPA